MILAIDPGTTHSAVLGYDSGIKLSKFIQNDDMLFGLRTSGATGVWAVEMVACYGMPVGREVFETCLVIGRIQEIAFSLGVKCRLVFRKDIKLHLCGTARAKDANIRQALIDRIGPAGSKKEPGPTYGITKHAWAALAIAVYAEDTK